MDQSRYWIGKERTCLNSRVLSSFGDSWEEQAFAEDAAGPLGGCIWPPRSYTCSFCRREFRSAQALGGHMNVHRRDRARLKQISSPKRNQILEPNTSLGGCMLQYPDEICNPNFDLDHALYSSTTPRPSTASVLPPFTYSFAQDQQKSTPILSWSKLEPTKKIPISDYRNQKGCTKALDSNFTTIKENNNQIEVHIPGKSCLLGIRRRCEAPISDDKDDMDNGLIFKKRRTDHDTRSFFPKAGHLVNGDQAESVASFEHSPTSTLENLDLELRLGDRP